jgi:hypothetical protein
VDADPGIPSVSKGTMEPVLAALFDDSGPTKPGSAPLPNLSGVLETVFSKE